MLAELGRVQASRVGQVGGIAALGDGIPLSMPGLGRAGIPAGGRKLPSFRPLATGSVRFARLTVFPHGAPLGDHSELRLILAEAGLQRQETVGTGRALGDALNVR